MARHNVIFGKDREVSGGYAGFSAAPPAPQQGQSYGYPAPPAQAYNQGGAQQAPWAAPQPVQGAPGSTEHLQQMYAQPAATPHDTGRMSMGDALNAITASLGLLSVVAVAVGLMPTLGGLVAGEDGKNIAAGIAAIAMGIGFLVGFVLALVNIFKKNPSPALVLAYAFCEGLAVGGLSGILEMSFPGIALQAVGATVVVAGTVLVLFRANILRTSPVLTKIFMVAMVAYMIFSLVSIGFSFFAGYSLRTGVFGLVIGAIAVVMSAYSLVMDFEDVKHAASHGAPRRYAWRCAFGVTVTIVWMYLEILRILQILRSMAD